MIRWNPHTKAKLIDGIRAGRLDKEEAMREHGISPEEYAAWERAYDEGGTRALRRAQYGPRHRSWLPEVPSPTVEPEPIWPDPTRPPPPFLKKAPRRTLFTPDQPPATDYDIAVLEMRTAWEDFRLTLAAAFVDTVVRPGRHLLCKLFHRARAEYPVEPGYWMVRCLECDRRWLEVGQHED